ncbi:MAG: TonB box-like protein [Candidatus Saccharibacteria bacterium]|nr:TonB box-like protein [Candidatus Saccharibacteria bacterium]
MHIPQDELLERIENAKQKVEVGTLYAHYKSRDKAYKVINIAITEADDELCVIYQAQYGSNLIFVRPLQSWLEAAELDGKQVPRFTKI